MNIELPVLYEAATDVPPLAELLASLEESWRQAGHPLVEALRPGLSEDQVCSMLDEHGLKAPREVVDWFMWHDGYTGEVWQCAPGGSTRSLAQSLSEYANPLLYDIKGRAVWGHGWLPIVRWPWGAYMASNCTTAGRYAATAALDEFGVIAPAPRIVHAALAIPIHWWLQRWTSGAWYVFTEGPSQGAVEYHDTWPQLTPGDEACGII